MAALTRALSSTVGGEQTRPPAAAATGAWFGLMPPASTAEMKEFAEFVREFVTTIQAAKTAGKTSDEAAAAWSTPAKYKGYAPANADRAKAYAAVIYSETK